MMKSTIIFSLTAFLVLLVSCEKEPTVNPGFDSTIDKNPNGLVITHLSRYDERIYLNGVISLVTGEVMVNLMNPEGVAVYSRTLIAPVEVQINETFDATPGYWKLKYSSRKGIGELKLHLSK